MDTAVQNLLRLFYPGKLLSFPRIGGGFYADVYLAQLEGETSPVVVKIYKKAGMQQEETRQLTLLRQHALLRMPQIFWTHDADETVPLNAIGMEYLPGETGGDVHLASPAARRRVAEQLVGNLLAWHDVSNPAGFGPLDGPFVPDWRTCYRPRVSRILEMAEALRDRGQLREEVFALMRRAAGLFDEIFRDPVPRPALIHGDYNMWNFLLDREQGCVTAVIDPCNCHWADPEFDLYQLDNANGKEYGLLDLYRSRRPLSPNFAAKNAFYELFTEMEHYYLSGENVLTDRVQTEADALAAAL